MTTPDDIRRWLSEAKQQKATHMLVVCDTWDYQDYPVFVKPGESVRKEYEKRDDPREMRKVMEVYAMHLDLEAQLAEHRAFHFEEPPS